MSYRWDANEIKKQVSLASLLAQLGYQPVRKSGKELFYLSMIRDSDINPSFCVNDRLGVWFDHGLGKGGNVIDFALAYWAPLPFGAAIEKMMQAYQLPLPLTSTVQPAAPYRDPKPAPEPRYWIHAFKDLGNHPLITGYLQSRGVWQQAQTRMKELYYYVKDDHDQKRNYFSAGWPNEKGGWEVRNASFKGSLGPKAMSFIPGTEARKLVLFEGFMDYLSWLNEHNEDRSAILVLNSLALLPAAIARAQSYAHISVFFDHDAAGYAATEKLLTAIPWAMDLSGHYQGFNDYNEKLISANAAAAAGQPGSLDASREITKFRR